MTSSYLVEVEYSEDSLGILAEYDAAASVKRFGELLEDELREVFPDAEIAVKAGINDRHMVYSEDGAEVPWSELVRLDDTIDRVFVGAEWAINLEQEGHSHLCAACGRAYEHGLFDCEIDRDHNYGLCAACAAKGINLND